MYTEKYLTAIQLAENMSLERKNEIYRYIIEMVLLDNSAISERVYQQKNKNNIKSASIEIGFFVPQIQKQERYRIQEVVCHRGKIHEVYIYQ